MSYVGKLCSSSEDEEDFLGHELDLGGRVYTQKHRFALFWGAEVHGF